MFNKEKKPARPRRTRSPEEKLKAFAHKALMERAKNNWRTLDQVIKKYTGVDVTFDDAEASLRELQNQVHRMALQRILDRPDLLDMIAEAELQRDYPGVNFKGNACGRKKEAFEGTANKRPADTIDAALDLLEKAERLKKKAGAGGGGPGAWAAVAAKLLDPEVLKLGLTIVAQRLGVNQAAAPSGLASSERQCTFMLNGRVTQATESVYLALLAAGLAQPVTEVWTGAPSPGGTIPPQAAPPKSPVVPGTAQHSGPAPVSLSLSGDVPPQAAPAPAGNPGTVPASLSGDTTPQAVSDAAADLGPAPASPGRGIPPQAVPGPTGDPGPAPASLSGDVTPQAVSDAAADLVPVPASPGGDLPPQAVPQPSVQPAVDINERPEVDLTKYSFLLNKTPEDAVNYVERDPTVQWWQRLGLWFYLTRPGANIETVTEQLSRHTEHPLYGPLVTHLLSYDGRQWLTEFMRLMKERLATHEWHYTMGGDLG